MYPYQPSQRQVPVRSKPRGFIRHIVTGGIIFFVGAIVIEIIVFVSAPTANFDNPIPYFVSNFIIPFIATIPGGVVGGTIYLTRLSLWRKSL